MRNRVEGSDRTVLVVDDDPSIRLVCRTNLQAAGFRVVEAADGEAALAAVRVAHPDVIVLDILMPGTSGWEVAAMLLGDRATDEIPIIFLSALTAPVDRLRAVELGAVDYITKPFDPETLAPTITAVLDQISRGERSAMIAEKLETLRAELGTLRAPRDGSSSN